MPKPIMNYQVNQIIKTGDFSEEDNIFYISKSFRNAFGRIINIKPIRPDYAFNIVIQLIAKYADSGLELISYKVNFNENYIMPVTPEEEILINLL